MDVVWQGEIPGLDVPGRIVRQAGVMWVELLYGPIGWTGADDRDTSRAFREAFASELRRREAQAVLDADAEKRQADERQAAQKALNEEARKRNEAAIDRLDERTERARRVGL